jgi:hypothetical protein
MEEEANEPPRADFPRADSSRMDVRHFFLGVHKIGFVDLDFGEASVVRFDLGKISLSFYI